MKSLTKAHKFRKVILIPGAIIVLTALIIGGYFAYRLFTESPEERILRKAMGTYRIKEYLYTTELVAELPEPQVLSKEDEAKIILEKDKYISVGQKTAWGIRGRQRTVRDVAVTYVDKYQVVKVDSDFWSNEVREQGYALRSGLIRFSKDLNKYEAYAIFMEPPAKSGMTPPEFDTFVLYNINGEYYCAAGMMVAALEKIK